MITPSRGGGSDHRQQHSPPKGLLSRYFPFLSPQQGKNEWNMMKIVAIGFSDGQYLCNQ
jgi:hypothetical protein